MGLETGSFIPELVDSNPDGVDPKSEGDNHLRLIKTCVQGSFPAFVGTTAVPKFVAYSEEQLSDAGLLTDTDTATRSFLTPLSIHSAGDLTNENRILRFQLNDGTSVGRVGYVGQDIIELRNQIISGNLELLAQNALDAGTTLLRGNPDGNLSLFDAGVLRFHTAAGGIASIRSDGATDTEDRYLSFLDSTGVLRALVGFNNSSDLELRNSINSGLTRIRGTNTSAVARTMINGDPDGGVDIFHPLASAIRLGTGDQGSCGLFSDGNTDAEPRQLLFNHQDGTLRGFVGYGGDPNIVLENRISSGQILLRARNAGASVQTIMDADPDGATTFRGATNISLKPAAGAAEGIVITGGGSVDLYHNGTRRFQASANGIGTIFSDGSTDTQALYLTLAHQDTTARAFIGFQANNLHLYYRNLKPSGRVILQGTDAGSTNRISFDANPDTTTTIDGSNGIMILTATNKSLGFYGSTGVIKQTVTGAKGANEALTSLMPALAALGLVIDNTTF